MEAIALIFSKFSAELIQAQLALVFFASSIAVYWMLIRKKKRESAEWVPAALVRNYLDKVQADERDIRFKLFGEVSAPVNHAPLAMALQTASTGVDANLLRELEALRAQLSMADQRAMEFDRNMNAIRAEKAALEQKLKDAIAAAAAGGATVVTAAADPNAAAAAAAAQKELTDLKAKLQEYEVIEDDLANLKKFQKENEQLRQKVEQYEKGGTPAATVAGSAPQTESATAVSGAAAAAPAMTVIPGGAAPAASETMVVSGGNAASPAAEAPAAAAPASATAPAADKPETNTNVLQAVTPTVDSGAPASAPAAAAAPAAEAAPEKSAEQKEEDLLNEFEKMLAS